MADELAEEEPAEPGEDARSAFGRRTRDVIESRVLALLEESLGEGFPFGTRMLRRVRRGRLSAPAAA